MSALAAVLESSRPEGIPALEPPQPVMIRLETPAQVMLAVGASSRACRPSPRRSSGLRLPVGAGQGPDLGLDGDADLAGGVQAQEGVLGVRVIAGRRAWSRNRSTSRAS